MISDTTIIDKIPVYVLALGDLPGWKQRWYINSRNFAILRFEGESNYNFGSEKLLPPGKGSEFRYRHLLVINDFIPDHGKYYLSYLRMRLEGDNAAGNYMVFEREMAINHILTQQPARITKDEAMKSVRLEDQKQPYDEAFWKNYTILLRTPLQESVIKDLEGNAALEKQFKKTEGGSSSPVKQ